MRKSILFMGLGLPAMPAQAAGQAEPPPLQKRARAVESMVQSSGDESLSRFIERQIAPAFRDSMPPRELAARLRAIREAVGRFGDVLYSEAGENALRVTFGGQGRQRSILFRIEPDSPHRIVSIDLD